MASLSTGVGGLGGGEETLHPPGVQLTIPGMLTPPALHARLALGGLLAS